MRRSRKTLTPLGPRDGRPASPEPPASGFLTIGGTTYVDPVGSYPLDHRIDGSATLIINDTDRPVTIVTERHRDHPPTAPPSRTAPPSPAVPPAPAGHASSAGHASLVLAPGERIETRRGDSVRISSPY
ncbi:hypothetical protein [Streptomyces lydicus]|uniref:Uncharacterized protein n=1 Tax=Streptomyces lydicus TaxID=47763 RepID=A0A1D7VGF0_9ACTN|nr:hypothetical protein [Streptomyces lydicus]AOP45816.1 hypothetical protein SL103_05795 [Streptomyces lydicus]